jgi:uncharacterized membrane protein YphA (DoxX/SURF4 family)
MRTRDRVALTIPSLLLRLMLAVTFLWAGLGKLLTEIDLPGPVAARLGLVAPAALPAEAVAPAPPPLSAVESQLPEPAPRDPEPSAPASSEPIPAIPTLPASSAEQTPEAPATPTAAPSVPAVSPAAASVDASTQPVRARRLIGLAVLVQNAAVPQPDAAGATPVPILPAGFGASPWPVSLAWAAAITEILAGLFLLLGLLTRPAALALAGVMLTAMWLTEIGPAVQAGKTVLGFLPDRDPADAAAWTRLLWQFSLFMSALAVAFLGSGRLGVDHRLFAPPSDLFESPPPRTPAARRSRDETIP